MEGKDRDRASKKQEIIKKTWEYLMENGLENASIGDLCRKTGLAQSSLYHWFVNKDDIWISAGRYGLAKEVESLFAFTLEHTNDVKTYFETLLDETEKYKYDLRLALEITTSPKYGEKMREKSKDFRMFYEGYAEKLMSIFDCTYLQAEVFIYSIISYIVDYVVWDDRIKTQMLLDNLHKHVIEALNPKNETK